MWKAWIAASRPKTLPAAIVPVLLGTALALHEYSANWVPAFLCLLFALLIQIGTNFANDYYDYLKGADTSERLGPARAVASGWIQPKVMRNATAATFLLALLVGSFLVPYGGTWLWALGIICILCGIAYTGGPYPLGYNGLGDLFVLIFFGAVATGVTYYVQTGSFRLPASGNYPHWLELSAVWWVAAFPGALAANLLAVNNYRDAETDAKVAKRTLAVRFGRPFVLAEYQLLLAIGFGSPIVLWLGGFRIWILLPLLLTPPAWQLATRLPQCRDRHDYQKILSGTARLLMAGGLLFTLGLVMSRQ